MKITLRIFLLIFFVIASLIAIFSIPPLFLSKGVVVSSIEKNSSFFNEGLRPGFIIYSINDKEIKDIKDYSDFVSSLENLTKIELKTNKANFLGFFSKDDFLKISVASIPKTRIRTGLDIAGGARALVSSEEPLSDSQLDDLIAVSQQRFNAYGLTDVQIRKVSDLSGKNFMLIEIAGSSPSDLEELIAKQGKFEAKIGNETVFVGGNEDITYVGRSGREAFIESCFQVEGGEACNFRFTIYLSEKAAKRHAEVTKNLDINLSSGGKYLSKQIDFYLDDELTESLNIGAELKGKETTQIMISGSGFGKNREDAYKEAEKEMKKLQTILITGSLPYKLKIEKIDRISPRLGADFTKQILLAGIFAFLAVGVLIFFRYNKIKYLLVQMSVLASEIIIILGISSLIKWNLDLPSIAGIIATIGTGIDSQLVIMDEARRTGESLREKIRKALFIVVTSFLTLFVALLPLTGMLSFLGIGAVSAGLLKGFAVTTIIGISVGILITRPAFSDIVKQLNEN